MQQFVIEAGTVSGFGGIIGIFLGGVVAYIIGKVMSISVVPSVSAITIAFSVSVGIGIIFGFLIYCYSLETDSFSEADVFFK